MQPVATVINLFTSYFQTVKLNDFGWSVAECNAYINSIRIDAIKDSTVELMSYEVGKVMVKSGDLLTTIQCLQ